MSDFWTTATRTGSNHVTKNATCYRSFNNFTYLQDINSTLVDSAFGDFPEA